mmetsp:Transcript_15917/g.31214  ORF Transcript_15917/g.31214 Transcript_15917/m.31214 type:complete len:471 (+) Transcript_15917:25-1437(+)
MESSESVSDVLSDGNLELDALETLEKLDSGSNSPHKFDSNETDSLSLSFTSLKVSSSQFKRGPIRSTPAKPASVSVTDNVAAPDSSTPSRDFSRPVNSALLAMGGVRATQITTTVKTNPTISATAASTPTSTNTNPIRTRLPVQNGAPQNKATHTPKSMVKNSLLAAADVKQDSSFPTSILKKSPSTLAEGISRSRSRRHSRHVSFRADLEEQLGALVHSPSPFTRSGTKGDLLRDEAKVKKEWNLSSPGKKTETQTKTLKDSPNSSSLAEFTPAEMQAIQLLSAPKILLKLDRRFRLRDRWLFISPDGSQLLWEKKWQKRIRQKLFRDRTDTSLLRRRDLAAVTGILYGIDTSAGKFEKVKGAKAVFMTDIDPCCCFTVVFDHAEDTLDLAARTPAEAVDWVLGLQTLMPLTAYPLTRESLQKMQEPIRTKWEKDQLGFQKQWGWTKRKKRKKQRGELHLPRSHSKYSD